MAETKKTLEDVINEVIDSFPRNGATCYLLASRREFYLKKIMRELRRSKIKASKKKMVEVFDRLAEEKHIKFV